MSEPSTADSSQLHQFLQKESVLTIATADACGPWSAPVLYVADISAEPFALYFLSSANSRHIKSLPLDGAAAVSIYSDYDGNWQSIRGAQIHGTIRTGRRREQGSNRRRLLCPLSRNPRPNRQPPDQAGRANRRRLRPQPLLSRHPILCALHQ